MQRRAIRENLCSSVAKLTFRIRSYFYTASENPTRAAPLLKEMVVCVKFSKSWLGRGELVRF